MKIGILGLPQAGKRTLFRLLTGRSISGTRRPGEIVEGVAPIRDSRVDALTRICRPRKTTYAENSFVLCPDLIEETRHRDWLNAARRCDLLCILLRDFKADQVYHPAGSIDSERDRATLLTALVLSDLEILLNRLNRITKEKMSGQTAAQAIEEAALRKCEQLLDNGELARGARLSADENAAIRSLELVTRLPAIWAINTSEDDTRADVPTTDFRISCRIEEEIASMEEHTERQEFLESIGVTSSGLDRINAAAYDTLNLMSFYTIGSDEVRAWTIRKGSTAREAGGKIHSDIARGFIRVEVIKYDDLIRAGSEKAVKDQGKVQVKGRDYVMEDGDICHFLFSV